MLNSKLVDRPLNLFDPVLSRRFLQTYQNRTTIGALIYQDINNFQGTIENISMHAYYF